MINTDKIMSVPYADMEAMNMINSLQARQQLLDALNQRKGNTQGDPKQQLQGWIDELIEQQHKDMENYKTHLFKQESLQHDVVERPPDNNMHEQLSGVQNDWTTNFADDFIEFLKIQDGDLYDKWFGKFYGYPKYIGFDIMGQDDNFDFYGDQVYWIAISLWQNQISAGVHFRDSYYYQELEKTQLRIDSDFSAAHGITLEWKPTTGQAGIYRIFALLGVDTGSNQQILFETMTGALEQLCNIFEPQLDDIYQKRYTRTRPLPTR